MAQSVTLTATPSPAEVVRDATQIIDTWNSLGPLMAVLGLAGLALAIVLLISWFNRNTISSTVSVLTSTIAHRDAEIEELKSDAKEFRSMHIESLTAISDQATRSNDVLDAWNRRGIERDADQKLMAAALNTLVSDGSVPLRKLMNDVSVLMATINTIEPRTAQLTELAITIPALRTELNTKLDAVMTEVMKRSTKPIPKIDMPAITISNVTENDKGTP